MQKLDLIKLLEGVPDEDEIVAVDSLGSVYDITGGGTHCTEHIGFGHYLSITSRDEARDEEEE